MFSISGHKWLVLAPQSNIARNLIERSEAASKLLQDEDSVESETEETDEENLEEMLECEQERDEEQLREITRDQLFAENLDFLSQSEHGVSGSFLQENKDASNPTPDGFYAFKRDGCDLFVRKSSLLWMIDNKQKLKVSTDRSRRFITCKESIEDDFLTCGGFVKMKVSKRDALCHRLQVFDRKRNVHRCFMSANGQRRLGTRGVAVLCNIFNVKNEIVTSSGQPFKYIDIKYFKMHGKLKHDLFTNDLRIV